MATVDRDRAVKKEKSNNSNQHIHQHDWFKFSSLCLPDVRESNRDETTLTIGRVLYQREESRQRIQLVH